MMQHMAAYAASSNITTELIQKYLDENKQLILAILDNQNLGKLNECATYQAKLQQNLMYLAAIADAQPQQAGSHAAHNQPQAAPAAQIQPAQQYLQQQQLFMSNQRNSSIPQYLQQSQQVSQQSFYTQQAIMSSAGGGGSGLHMLSSDNSRGMAGDNGPHHHHHHHHHQLELQSAAGFSDGGSSRDHGNNIQSSQQLGLQRGHDQMHHAGGGGGPDHLGVSSPLGHRDIGGSGQAGGDDSEASYLKGSDASSL
ncbi:hypothetical protein CY35_04G133000 [Sphagnum magellanicum]|nr:hypothetical protein CY35_04G133000 [Sphagnum magellanicum]KAH9566547.1 hypothetical protein CY35_04G133000 [Sphagnum magellanicum]KAH9566548.1 hypothetical protein CY35_04G133000 [Sphagnum magellanicum]